MVRITSISSSQSALQRRYTAERKAISAGRSPYKDSKQTIEKRGTGVRQFLAVNKKEERNRGNIKKD